MNCDGYCPYCQIEGKNIELKMNTSDLWECPSCNLQFSHPDGFTMVIIKEKGKGVFRKNSAKATEEICGALFFEADKDIEVLPSKDVIEDSSQLLIYIQKYIDNNIKPQIINPTEKSKYNSKALDSSKTRLDLFLFNAAITNPTLNEININLKTFKEFTPSDDLINLYSTVYWQYPLEHKIKDITINKIYDGINQWNKTQSNIRKELQKYYVENIFPKLFPYPDFVAFITENKECHYCGISVDKINDLIEKKKIYKKHITRGWTLEIDRKEANKEYLKENSVMCCYWCNNAKTDEFSEGEFLKVGKVIKEIWAERIKNV